MLLAKPIVIVLTIATLAVATQFYPNLNFNYSLGKNLTVDRSIDLTSPRKIDTSSIDYLCEISAASDCQQLSRKPLNNRTKYQMKIKFRQSGGYAGLRTGYDLDLNSLPTDEAKKVQDLVTASGILQTSSNRSKNAADLINYEISIESSQGTHQISLDDLTLTENILPLLDYLQERAKPLK